MLKCLTYQTIIMKIWELTSRHNYLDCHIYWCGISGKAIYVNTVGGLNMQFDFTVTYGALIFMAWRKSFAVISWYKMSLNPEKHAQNKNSPILISTLSMKTKTFHYMNIKTQAHNIKLTTYMHGPHNSVYVVPKDRKSTEQTV